MRPFPCCCYFVYLQSKPNFLSWRCLNQAIGAGSGLQLFCYRGWGAERTLACFSPYGFSIRNVSTYGFRIMASSECGRAAIAGYVGQLLEHCFNPFKGKCFRCIVVQEIGIPSISLFSLIDQSVMLNSPFLPPTPCCKTVDRMGGIYLA